MPWARFDDKFYAHPKTYRLGKLRLPAIGLHLLAVTWSCDQLTDGVIPEDALVMLGGTPAVAQALVHAGMWHHSEERREYLIHDFIDYNKSRDQVLRDREKWRERQGASRGVSQGVSRRDTQRDAQESLARVTEGVTARVSSESRSPVPVPVPEGIKRTGTGAKSTGEPTHISDVFEARV